MESGGILLETLRNAERRAELKTEKTTTVEVKAPPDIPAVSDIRRHQQQPTDVVSNVTTATTTSTTNSSDVTPALVVRTAEQTPPPKRLSVDVRKLEVKEGGEVVVPVMTSSVTSVVTSSVPVVTTSPVTVTMPQVSLATSSVSEPSIPPLVATPGSPMVEDRVVPDTPKSESVRPRPKRLRTDR